MFKKRKREIPTSKAGAWFIPVRGSYLPASKVGWLTYIPYSGYLIAALYFGIKDTNSVSLAILIITPNWIAAIAIMTYLASHRS